VWTHTHTSVQTSTHMHAYTHAQRFAPLGSRKATARTPLVPSTGARAGAERENCVCNLERVHNPWFLCSEVPLYVWLELVGLSRNPV
jgi:hypothetical protein